MESLMKNIIIVDMQKGLIKVSNKYLVDKINNYLTSNNFDNIFVTQCINNNQSPYTRILKWNGIKDTSSQELVINMPKSAKIIVKNCYGLSQKDIDLFKSLNINEMEICGTDIDACCLAIGFNLFDNNIKPIFIKELCGTSARNCNMFDYAIPIIKRQFGEDSIR